MITRISYIDTPKRKKQLPLPISLYSVAANTVTLTGIASSLAFGTMQIDMNTTLTGIASTVGIGADRIDLNVSPTGIASTLGIGSDRVDFALQLSGILNTQGFGTDKIDLNINLAGIASSAVLGTMNLGGPAPSHDVTLSGIVPTTHVGIPTVYDPNAITIPVISTTTAFGSFSITQQAIPTNSAMDTNIPWEWVNSQEKYQLYVYLVNFINSVKKKDERVISVTSNPSGVVSAQPGTIALNLGGGVGNTIWVKRSGLDSSGWDNLA